MPSLLIRPDLTQICQLSTKSKSSAGHHLKCQPLSNDMQLNISPLVWLFWGLEKTMGSTLFLHINPPHIVWLTGLCHECFPTGKYNLGTATSHGLDHQQQTLRSRDTLHVCRQRYRCLYTLTGPMMVAVPTRLVKQYRLAIVSVPKFSFSSLRVFNVKCYF